MHPIYIIYCNQIGHFFKTDQHERVKSLFLCGKMQIEMGKQMTNDIEVIGIMKFLSFFPSVSVFVLPELLLKNTHVTPSCYLPIKKLAIMTKLV